MFSGLSKSRSPALNSLKWVALKENRVSLLPAHRFPVLTPDLSPRRQWGVGRACAAISMHFLGLGVQGRLHSYHIFSFMPPPALILRGNKAHLPISVSPYKYKSSVFL